MYWLDDLSRWSATSPAISLSDNTQHTVNNKYPLKRKSSLDSSSIIHGDGPTKKPELAIKLSIGEGIPLLMVSISFAFKEF